MEKIEFSQLQEQLYHEKMDNGLQVYILPKPEFNKTFATFTTNYGSIDNQFVPLNENEMTKVPDGIAHFLEHKLFEKKTEMSFSSLVNKVLRPTHLLLLPAQLTYSAVHLTLKKILKH